MKYLRRPILLFALLAIAVAMGFTGSSLSPIAIGNDADIAQGVATVEPGETLIPQVAPTPTTTTVTAPPTPEPTNPPTPTQTPLPTPTVEPEETPRPEPPPNTTGASIIFERGTSSTPQIALTFDAGEGAGYTEEILDFLSEHELKGSFGITGEWAREHPELVQRMVDEGHMVINHSESHQSWTGYSSDGVPLTEDERLDELLDAEEAIEEATGGYEPAPYWRPPYGDYDAEGQELLAEYGYDYTLYWTCDTVAWMGTTPEEIVEKCGPDSQYGGPGAVILMHVTQEADYLALEGFLEEYGAEGYEFVTLEEMIAGS